MVTRVFVLGPAAPEDAQPGQDLRVGDRRHRPGVNHHVAAWRPDWWHRSARPGRRLRRLEVNDGHPGFGGDHRLEPLKGDVRLLHRDGDPAIKLHEGRHSAASLARDAGVDAKIRQEQLGHATKAMTDHCTHVLAEAHLDAAEAVARLVGEAGS